MKIFEYRINRLPRPVKKTILIYIEFGYIISQRYE